MKPNKNLSLITESPSNYSELEKMSTNEILKGINQEDKIISNTILKVLPSIEKLVDHLVISFNKGGRLFYIGAGTSGRLGVLDASEIPTTFGVDPTKVVGLIAGGDTALRVAIEGAEDDYNSAWKTLEKYHLTHNDTLIGIAASGTTKYVLGGVEKAKKHNILTAGITNNPKSPLAEETDIPIILDVGPEFITGSTRMKSGTSQKLVLNMISTTLMIKLGKVKGSKMVDMKISNKKLLNRGIKMIIEELSIDEDLAKKLLLEIGSVRAVITQYKK